MVAAAFSYFSSSEIKTRARELLRETERAKASDSNLYLEAVVRRGP
jgi:hypothetical protein